MLDVPKRNAFAAARHVLEKVSELHPELGDLPVERTDPDWPAWLDRALEAAYLSEGEKILLDIGAGIWTERHPFVQQLIGLDEANREAVLRAVVALAGMTGELTRGSVVAGAFGPQFTLAERALMAEALAAFIGTVRAVQQSGIVSDETTAGMTERGEEILRELIARLQS